VDKESIRCFPPQPDYNYQIFYQVRYARYFLYESDIPKFDSKYKIIEEECFPHL
jgi:hypothetical protein